MATATSRSRQQVSRRPVQHSSGWPLSAKQTLIVGGVAAVILLGCVVVVLAFGGKSAHLMAGVASKASSPSLTIDELDRVHVDKVVDWAKQVLGKSSREQRQLLSQCERRRVSWTFPASIVPTRDKVQLQTRWDAALEVILSGFPDSRAPLQALSPRTERQVRTAKEIPRLKGMSFGGSIAKAEIRNGVVVITMSEGFLSETTK